MAGKRTPEQISYNMSQIRGKDTKIELMLRKELWSRGIRYRKNVAHIIGKPDIAFIGLKVAVFCDSEFWHGYDWEERKHDFKTNREKWIAKIERNMERDKEVNKTLKEQGWIVLRFWGNDIKMNVSACADAVEIELLKRNVKPEDLINGCIHVSHR
jgi:DNA mismatch endonuclease (patch repair protein)